MSVVVHEVVSEFEFVEGDDLFHPLRTFSWGIWMHVDSTRHLENKVILLRKAREILFDFHHLQIEFLEKSEPWDTQYDSGRQHILHITFLRDYISLWKHLKIMQFTWGSAFPATTQDDEWKLQCNNSSSF